ncbi:energy transducer TonB [Cognatilysobacter segetis]|uniref:energy transducer TonB n=1 Tax=Cognatilysobacter segetis TaxID=2492394 RepID=UPI00105BA9C1|nr:energy transducer TonB [Lysobacter segetis]
MQTIHAPRVAPLDPNRIAAISGAIAVNGLLFALLVAPFSSPVVVQAVRDSMTLYTPVKPKLVPPPKPEPIRTKVEQAHSAPARPAQAAPAVDPPPVADPMPQVDDLVVPPMTEDLALRGSGDAVIAPADDGKPLAGAHLEYAANPAPAYPRDSLVQGDTGTVLLEVLVDVDGRPLQVTISRSSGHRELDLAAKRQVLAHWRFKPAMRNGRPVQAIGLVPVDFSLQ